MPKASLTPAAYVPAVDVKKAEIALTASQINNLMNFPVEAIPAPGVGKNIIVRAVTVKHIYGTVEFGTSPAICYATDPLDMSSIIVESSFVMQSASTQKRYYANANPFANWPIRENDGVVITATGTLIPDGDGSGEIEIEYTVEDY